MTGILCIWYGQMNRVFEWFGHRQNGFDIWIRIALNSQTYVDLYMFICHWLWQPLTQQYPFTARTMSKNCLASHIEWFRSSDKMVDIYPMCVCMSIRCWCARALITSVHFSLDAFSTWYNAIFNGVFFYVVADQNT